jgi:hypothetical protein
VAAVAVAWWQRRSRGWRTVAISISVGAFIFLVMSVLPLNDASGMLRTVTVPVAATGCILRGHLESRSGPISS